MRVKLKKPDMKVAEAMNLSAEMDSMLASADDDQRQWLTDEFEKDPNYSTALRGKETLADILGYIATKETPVNSPSAQSEIKVDLEELLKDLEGDHEAIASRAAVQKRDITAIHELATNYNHIYPPRKVTKKERGNLARLVGTGFKEQWSAEELANDPIRLKDILDSLWSMDDISQEAKNDIEEFIARKVCDYVRSTVRSTGPDVLAKRLEASLLPGFASETLQKNLLGCYFSEAAGFQNIEDVLETYENLVRAIIRLSDSPDIAKQAIAIGSFNTSLLTEDSLYRAKALAAPMLRMDKPQLFGRAFDAARTIAVLGVHFDAISEVERPRSSVMAPLTDIMDRFVQTGISNAIMRDFNKHNNRVPVIEAGIAINILGEDKYNNRFEIIQEFIRLCRNPDQFYDIMFEESDPFNDSDSSFSSMLVYVGRHLRQQHPESQDFLDQFLNNDYPASREFAEIYGDIATKYSQKLRSIKGGNIHINALKHKIEQASGENIDYEEFANVISSRTNIITRFIGEGYVLDYMAEPGIDVTETEWQKIEAAYTPRIQEAKDEISQTKGLSRRAVTIGDPSTGRIFVIRPESEADHKTYHPVDRLLQDMDAVEASELTLYERESNLALIEACRLKIATERRRFLNERGIVMKQEEDGERFSLTINKHPRNPQFFICKLELADQEGSESAWILMNSDLRFELGDKKVRSPIALSEFNALAAYMLVHFMCMDAVETEEGVISDERNVLTSRIAHLRLLPDGYKYSYESWSNCLEVEGLDLEVLSELQQQKYDTTRKSTYVKAVEKDDVDQGPLHVYIPLDDEPEDEAVPAQVTQS